MNRIRWFYAFLLLLGAWGGFVQLALKDSPHWSTWDEAPSPKAL
jgi:hypothetical protein